MKQTNSIQLIDFKLAGACRNRTDPAGLWPATLDLKSRRDTRTLCTPKCLKYLLFYTFLLSFSSVKFCCVYQCHMTCRRSCTTPLFLLSLYITYPAFGNGAVIDGFRDKNAQAFDDRRKL